MPGYDRDLDIDRDFEPPMPRSHSMSTVFKMGDLDLEDLKKIASRSDP